MLECFQRLLLLNRLHAVVEHVLHLGVITCDAKLSIVFADGIEAEYKIGRQRKQRKLDLLLATYKSAFPKAIAPQSAANGG
jgi:hypothetical protein